MIDKNALIKDILKKDISRKINGVVKAENNLESTVATELSEYVVTKEITKHLEKLFDGYVSSLTKETEDMGVWISGFFGSGKSHFLKMVGYIIENKEYGGKKATDYFKDKVKDSMLQANLEKASEKPTDVILFNIDNVSDQDTYQNKDAIVVAFLKKFNEYQGFSRDDIKVADFERMVWKKGKFQEFKDSFKEKTGDSWEQGRRNIDFNGEEFIEVVEELDIISAEDARRWLEKESIKSISVESFCDLLRDYLELKGKDHRIVFLVDEIGQYIGDNSHLMLNLQTLVENLGKDFQGRVWVGVTSQQDLGAVLDANDRRKNDFSKIQDRFKTMLPLSSANIDEVIKNRLLEKNEIVKEDLQKYYAKEGSVLKNLINFEENKGTLNLFKDKEDFSETYPFISYQFNLLQKVFEKVRDMGHSGQHMSRGERSLLNSFQEAGIRVGDKKIGALVPFHYFYESIEQFLEDNARRPIIHAKNDKGVDDFGIEVLKLLFLLKGINEIEPNLNILTSFMINSIDCDRIVLEEKIKKALSKLEQEVLIQKDGDAYYFLTNEEQDINKEIYNENVDLGDIDKSLDRYIFDEIFDNDFIIAEDTGNKYTFNRRIDEYYKAKAGANLNIAILTPRADDYDNISLLGNRGDEYELIIRLPENHGDYLEEIKRSLKIKSFIEKKHREQTREVIANILESKARENKNRDGRIRREIERAIEESEVYIRGHKFDIKSKSAAKVIEEALKASANNEFKYAKLIKKKYNEVRIRDVLLTEFDNENRLLNIDSDMEKNPNIDAINEVLNEIKRLDKRIDTLTLKKLVDEYTKKPYGWDQFSVNGIIAELWVYKRINISESKVPITDRKEVSDYLTRSQVKTLERLVITLKEEIDVELVKKVNNILQKLWGTGSTISSDSSKEELFDIVRIKQSRASGYKRECENNGYPGIKVLKEWIDLLDEILELKGTTEKILKEFIQMKDDLEEWNEKEATIEDFFTTSKKTKFDEGIKKLHEIDDLDDYIGELKDNESYIKLKEIIEMESPYSSIREIDGLLNNLAVEEKKIIDEERDSLLEKAEKEFKKLGNGLKTRPELLEESEKKHEEFKEEIANIKDNDIFKKSKRLENIIQEIEKSYRRDVVNDISTFKREVLEELKDKDSVDDLVRRVNQRFEDLKNETDYMKIKDLEGRLEIAESEKNGFIGEARGKSVKKQRVDMKKIVAKPKYNIVTESDVETYMKELEKEMESLKAKMLEAVKENKIVDIS